jgi:hypothetical protein
VGYHEQGPRLVACAYAGVPSSGGELWSNNCHKIIPSGPWDQDVRGIVVIAKYQSASIH